MCDITLSELKTHLNITDTNRDARLTTLADAVNAFVRRVTAKDWNVQTYSEAYQGTGQRTLTLRHYPVYSVTAVTYDGRALVLPPTPWDPDTTYSPGQLVSVGSVGYSAIVSNTNVNPIIDTAGSGTTWGVASTRPDVSVDYANAILEFNESWHLGPRYTNSAFGFGDNFGRYSIAVVYNAGEDVPDDLHYATLELAAWMFQATGGQKSVTAGGVSVSLASMKWMTDLPTAADTIRTRSDPAAGFMS